jgi:hypothetical protein
MLSSGKFVAGETCAAYCKVDAEAVHLKDGGFALG